MKIQAINVVQPRFTGRKHTKYNNVNKNANPIQEGVSTAGAWFAFGVALDFLSRKVTFSKSPMKNSLAMNGTIGACAGIFSWYKAMSNKNS